MNKTMYEVNWHAVNDVFSRCTVTPIKVIREGVLPGCTRVSISAKRRNGDTFQGSPYDYYLTEEAAWAAVKRELTKSIASLEMQLVELQAQLQAQRTYLAEHLE